jgi:hypothetical protein
MVAPASALSIRRVRFTNAADPRLVALIERGHPVLLIARYSNSGGSKAVRSSVNQLYGAARGLALHGVDVCHLLPDDRELLAAHVWANLETVTSRTMDGARFDNRFFFSDAHRTQGLLLSVSVGSGAKVDANSYHQPAVKRVADLLLAQEPGVVYASEISRLGRTHASFGPIPETLDELARRYRPTYGAGPWIGDEDGNNNDALGLPLAPYSPQVRSQMVKIAAAAEDEARKIAFRNDRGKVTGTPRRLAGGRALFSWELCPPAGFATAMLMDRDTGRRAGNLLYLDTDAARPTASEVALTVPGVPDGDGDHLADQAANVDWFLAHFGTPGYDYAACADALVARGYSTSGLRRQHGARAAWERVDDA